MIRVFVLLLFLIPTWAFAQTQTYKFNPPDFKTIQQIVPIKKNAFTADELNDLLKTLSLKKDVDIARIT